ncbi:MAG: DEAD/DEAH box helicase [Candidatus Aenigmarchaeota archaeon]|nr:DEAD/DEAH box helicase [Candidatus Aenigmarchaeota archaeon]
MQVEELSKFGIGKKDITKLKDEKISKLYPPQEDIIRKGLFKDKNLILSLPTASGKTLIATLSMLHNLSEKRNSKVVYIAPLVALAYEKYEYFKKFFDARKVAISVGDLDSSDHWLANYDVICVTTEKLDSLLRHNVEWVNRISLLIVDEIHLLNDKSRGPTLEILLVKLMKMVPNAQILGLSATISNAAELAKWLNSNLVISDFRPVKLYEGVSFASKIHFDEKDGYELDESEETENSIVRNTIGLNKQALIFTSTRRNAESLAERLSDTVRPMLKKGEHVQLETLSNDIENVLEYPTKQCEKLSECIKSGVAFHHAGLLGTQKRLIEENFRNGMIKTIVATPTLALGVNLPAFRVVIRDTKRYYPGVGAVHIPVLEYKQFIGRAGRPQYDTFGESILLAKTEDEARDLIQHFIYGEPENITSKLAAEPALRMHVLALIASDFCRSEDSLLKFFDRTFYAFHYGDTSAIDEKIIEILEPLISWKFVIKKGNELTATRIGKRVSELYIDPLTAHQFIDGLSRANKIKLNELNILQLLSNSIEMKPLLSVRSSEIVELQEMLVRNTSVFLQDVPEEYDLEFEDFTKSLKLTSMFLRWTDEATEDQILTKFKVAPGELRGRLELIDWLIYAFNEIALLEGHKDFLNQIRKLRVRLRYGIKEELTPLVRLKNVGRVRARKLYDAGLVSLDKLKKVPTDSLTRIVGLKVANDIKKQLGEKNEEIKDEKQITLNFNLDK